MKYDGVGPGAIVMKYDGVGDRTEYTWSSRLAMLTSMSRI